MDSLSKTTVWHASVAGTSRTGHSVGILRDPDGVRTIASFSCENFGSIANNQYSGMFVLSLRSIFIATRKNRLSGGGMPVPGNTGS
jgi:hypothetical protein